MNRYARLLTLGLAVAGLLLALMPSPSAAYIGPGGGLSLLTTALAMLAVFLVSAVVVLTWPVRAVKHWLQRRREEQPERGACDAQRNEGKRGPLGSEV